MPFVCKSSPHVGVTRVFRSRSVRTAAAALCFIMCKRQARWRYVKDSDLIVQKYARIGFYRISHVFIIAIVLIGFTAFRVQTANIVRAVWKERFSDVNVFKHVIFVLFFCFFNIVFISSAAVLSKIL